MSSLFHRHPEQDFVPYLDGELSARQAARVKTHLEGCAPCRAEFESLKQTLAECASYQSVSVAHMPEAPLPWRDLYRDFSRIDESLANTSLLVRLMRPLVHSGVPRWSFVAGLAALVVLGFVNQLRQAPSVQAASILRKAVAISQSKAPAARQIRVRTSRNQSFVRTSGMSAAVMQVVEAQVIASLFANARYDWNDPLSARAFVQWRDQQVQKTDEVTTVSDSSNPSRTLTRIRTVTPDGDLAAATITLSGDDYEAVEERLEFRDQEWVELSEIAESSTEGAGFASAGSVGLPVRAAETPSRPAAFSPEPASISDELTVLSALSSIEADLGEEVSVNLSGEKVAVTAGSGVTPRRQEAIRGAVGSLPRVALEFNSAHTSAISADTATPTGSVASSSPSPMEARLQKQLGGHAEFERFSNHLQDVTDAARQRVSALRNLAARFSPETEARLNGHDRKVLSELTRKHTAALAERVGELDRLLNPALASLGGTAAAVPNVSHANWQAASEAMQKNAQKVDVLVSQMLGLTSANAGSMNTLPSDLLVSLQSLHKNLEDCQKSLPR